jgi:hypothetical protein
MATERIIDLAGRRYADREYDGPLPVTGAAEEQARQERQMMALARLRRRVRERTGGRDHLDRSDLTDLLLVLGVEDW